MEPKEPGRDPFWTSTKPEPASYFLFLIFIVAPLMTILLDFFCILLFNVLADVTLLATRAPILEVYSRIQIHVQKLVAEHLALLLAAPFLLGIIPLVLAWRGRGLAASARSWIRLLPLIPILAWATTTLAALLMWLLGIKPPFD